MSDILTKIIATKRTEVTQRKTQTTLDTLRDQAEQQEPPRGFSQQLLLAQAERRPGVIAEIKKASPSKGVIREHFEPTAIAESYASAGATCLSVLTDVSYFQGADQYLRQARQATQLPVIRKDFTVDEYQVYEARALGADAILLIVAALDIMQLTVLHQTAVGLGLDVLIEVHNRQELDAALSLQPKMIGINNRNLKTFEVSLETTLDLLEHIPEGIAVVTESGISSKNDVQRMLDNHVFCFLVGEHFMRADDPGVALKQLFSL